MVEETLGSVCLKYSSDHKVWYRVEAKIGSCNTEGLIAEKTFLLQSLQIIHGHVDVLNTDHEDAQCTA